MISKQTLDKIRPIVGPPGTGKTHIKIKKLYAELSDKYGTERGIVLSHTKVAAAELQATIKSIDKIKTSNLLQLDEDYFQYRICTIHSYAKKHGGERREVFSSKSDFNNLCNHVPLFNLKKNAAITKDPQKNHPFFRCNAEAHGRGLNISDHWHTAADPHNSYKPYNLQLILKMKEGYEKFKKDEFLQDYQDMIDVYVRKPKVPAVDFLIIDEAQDCSKPQLLAIERMAEHVRSKDVIMVGDPNQTIFKFAGSDPDFFEKLFKDARGEDELEVGLRCSKAINKFCKEIIKPVWEKYGYTRVWEPTEVEGNVYRIPDLNKSFGLSKLLEKIKNSDEQFLFTYRSLKSKEWLVPFFERYGLKYKHVGSEHLHVSDAELNSHYTWPLFIKGTPQSLEQIQAYWKHLDKRYKKKDARIFKKMINKSYTFQEFVNLEFLDSTLSDTLDFYKLIKTPKDVEGKNRLQQRVKYIRSIINNNNLNQSATIEYGNFHKIKGLTRDNVIVDLSITRAEPYHEQLYLGYTACSRGRYDLWILKSQTGKELLDKHEHIQ